MPITIGDGGTNRAITSITVGDGGINRNLIEVWIGDGGTNRLVFSSITVDVVGLDPSSVVSPGPAVAVYGITASGLETATGSANNTWLLAGAATDYDVMLSVNSGSSPTGSALATWLNCGTNRSWTLTRNLIGVAMSDCTVQIRNATTLAVLDSANVQFYAEVA